MGRVQEVRIPASEDSLPRYRFDGSLARRSFVRDLMVASGVIPGDNAEAAREVNLFMSKGAAAVFSNISKANVAPLNAPVARTDLYNPGTSFTRPLWNLVSSGDLDSSLPMQIPNFSSASGLAGEHTEGVEPTPGTFVVSGQSVVPKAISGELVLDREIVDFDSAAVVDQIIFARMVSVWYDAIEARIMALLDALSLSPTVITGTGTDLDAMWEDFLSPLQFVRGGVQLTSLALADDLYGASRRARDDNGRRLFPVLSGGSLAIDGVAGVPAWQLATANGGAGNSYLFNPLSVYAWATLPRRFTFAQTDAASVTLGIWGYSAQAVTDAADVKRLTYSAS